MLEKHLIKATLLALRVSPHPLNKEYSKLLKSTPDKDVALGVLEELSEFYVTTWHSELKRVAGILKGYQRGAIPSKYR